MPKEIEKFNNPEFEGSERERELNELSKKAREIFEENFLKYKKFDNEEAKKIAKKWGFDKIGINSIQREIDEICYQIGDNEEELENNRFELGILDPGYQSDKILGIHESIKSCMKEKLRTKIDTWKPFLLKGILCEDNNGLRYLIIAGQQKESIDKKDYEDSISAIKGRIECDKEFAAKVAEMLKRYKITDIFFGDIDVIEKRVWDTQTSLYAEKEKMTNTELLRARLTGEWSKKKEENK